jgi:hypothetical protein
MPPAQAGSQRYALQDTWALLAGQGDFEEQIWRGMSQRNDQDTARTAALNALYEHFGAASSPDPAQGSRGGFGNHGVG